MCEACGERMIYDDIANARTEIEIEGHSTTTAFDLEGRVVRVDNAAGAEGSFNEIDRRGILSEFDRRFAYDTMGDRVRAIDPEDRVVTWTWDLRRRMATETWSEDVTTAFGCDPNGNRTSKTRPDRGVWRREYDADRLRAVVDPETNRTGYTYDPNGNLLTQTDGREKVTVLSTTSSTAGLLFMFPRGLPEFNKAIQKGSANAYRPESAVGGG
ncbi:MAG: RHS repeat protein [bacterium]|nr:RHS repeat protein [bacterium]